MVQDTERELANLTVIIGSWKVNYGRLLASSFRPVPH